MIGTRRIYDEWTAESDPAHQKYIGLILRLSCGAAIPPKQRKWPKCSQSGADLENLSRWGLAALTKQFLQARVKVNTLDFLKEILLSMEVAFSMFFLFMPISSFGWYSTIVPLRGTLLPIV